tara:strand:+ start:263 stop:805 length:543 start_codon:yes stop_codon:yes gene_type:complete
MMKQSTQGKLAIVVIFGVAIFMSVYAWWHNIHTGDQVIDFFGIETATRLRHADMIELFIIAENAEATDATLETSIGNVPVKSVQDISSARGLIHMRHIFIQDHTYLWDKSVPKIKPDWAFALRFTDTVGQSTLIFAPSTYTVEHIEAGKIIVMGELLDNLIRYLAESNLLSLDDVTSSKK